MAGNDDDLSTSRWTSLGRSVLDALGLVALHQSSRDVKLLCAQRFVRLFAYGASALVLVSFLSELRVTQTLVGLFMTLTLAGDVAISFLLALFADGIGRRAVLTLGALLMAASGLVFALVDDYWVLLVAAILGVISPGGNEIGPFRAIEESIVAHLVEPDRRGDVFAWYSLSGTAGAAFGIMTCGWVIHHLPANLHHELLDAYRVVFFAYSFIGLVKLVLVLALSSKVEAESKSIASAPAQAEQGSETSPLLVNAAGNGQSSPPTRPWLPNTTKESVPIVATLCLLFGLDSFASGLASL
jgi:MFS family permease